MTIFDEDDGARALSLDEILGEYEGRVIWIQVRERLAAMPAKFIRMTETESGESYYLAFDSTEKKGDHYYLRPTLMGKTWIAWSDKPTAMQRREAMHRG